MTSPFVAYADESSSRRGEDRQDYMVCAALIEETRLAAVRDALRPLRLPGQIKLHWSDERPSRHRQIVDVLSQLDSMQVIITHRSERSRKTERFRRKCLEQLYVELTQMQVHRVILESRQTAQNTKDIEHIVALQGQGQAAGIRLDHVRGGNDPLLWIPDAVLGALNATYHGYNRFWDALADKVVLHESTPGSLPK